MQLARLCFFCFEDMPPGIEGNYCCEPCRQSAVGMMELRKARRDREDRERYGQ